MVGSGGGARGRCIGRRVAGGCCWWRRLRRAIRFLKVSARDDRASHHLKEVSRYRGHSDPLRRAVQTGKSGAKRIDGSEILEIVFCAVAQVEKVGVGKGKIFDIPFLQVAAGQDQALRIFVRKLPQQHAVSDTKDRGAGADSERDGDHDCDREYGTLAQRAKRV